MPRLIDIDSLLGKGILSREQHAWLARAAGHVVADAPLEANPPPGLFQEAESPRGVTPTGSATSPARKRYAPKKRQHRESTNHDATNHWARIILAFAATAVVCGALALVPRAETAFVMGLLLCLLGPAWSKAEGTAESAMGSLLIVMGVLLMGGSILYTQSSVLAFLFVAALLGVAALVTRSGLLASSMALTLLAAMGGSVGYSHASYWVAIRKPVPIILVFSVLGIVGLRFIEQTAPRMENFANQMCFGF
jgi:hypothetical protein